MGLIMKACILHPNRNFMNNTCLLLATRLEAAVILDDPRCDWKPLTESTESSMGLESYFEKRTSNYLCITGIGPVSSALRFGLFRAQHKVSFYLNLGVAGALKDHLAVGDILEVAVSMSAFEKHPFERRFDKFKLSESTIVCLSDGEALHDERLRHKYAKKADLVDMELYSLAYGAACSGATLKSVKIISDVAQMKDAKEIVVRIPLLMKNLWGNIASDLFQLS